MWIRSQSRKELIKTNRLWVEGKDILNKPNTSSDDAFDLLGEYETEERAMEVLGMIEDRIMNGTKFDEIYNGRRTTRDFVFQMPQE